MEAPAFGTKRYYLFIMWRSAYTTTDAYRELTPKVQAQETPWVFTMNTTGGRRPKPISEQLIELQHEINRAFAAFDRAERKGELPETREETPEIPEPETPEIPAEPEAEKPQARGKGIRAEKIRFMSEWKRIRAHIEEGSARTGENPIDSLDSMRPVQDAKPLIEQGVTADHLISIMCLHWPQARKDMAQILAPDFMRFSPPIDGTDSRGYAFHKLAGYVLTLANARRNIMLIGAAGTGKSHIARQVAELISTDSHPEGLPYGETPMTPGATRGDLLGRHTISGFIPSQFVEIYSGGGVFNFEEIDASDPSMLIVVNNALASDRLFNSVNGEVYMKHPDFIAFATANTFGLGADSRYTGREKLDLATIDRFRMARVLVDLDESIADGIMGV